MSHPDERELRLAFAALRNAERDKVPPIAPLLANHSAPRRPARPTAFAWAGLAAAASVVAVAGYRGVQAVAAARAATQVVRALGPFAEVRWRSPTDPLLRTPGYELLVAVPSIATADSLETGVFP